MIIQDNIGSQPESEALNARPQEKNSFCIWPDPSSQECSKSRNSGSETLSNADASYINQALSNTIQESNSTFTTDIKNDQTKYGSEK